MFRSRHPARGDSAASRRIPVGGPVASGAPALAIASGAGRPAAGGGAGSGSADEPESWRSMAPYAFAGRGSDSGGSGSGGVTAPLLHRRAVTGLGFVRVGGTAGGSLALMSASADGSVSLTSIAGMSDEQRGPCALRGGA